MIDANEEEMEAAPGPSQKDVETVVEIAARQLAAQAEVDRLTAELKKAGETLKGIAEDELPKAVLLLGVREIPLRDGNLVSVATSYHAGISEANKPAAHGWLRENGHGDIIDNNITATFGQGENDLADEIEKLIREHAPENKLTRKESVHHSRLKAFVEEQIVSGSDLPQDLFGVYTRTVAVIAPPKNAKKAKLQKMAEDKF